MNAELTVFNRLRPMSIGFDSLFDHFESMFQSDFMTGSNYPPYNILRTPDSHYILEMAVAGFRKDEVMVSVQNNVLTVASRTVSSGDNDRPDDYDDAPQLIHRGISKRYFSRDFRLADGVNVVDAKMEDGMLSITLEKEIPEAARPKMIEIK